MVFARGQESLWSLSLLDQVLVGFSLALIRSDMGRGPPA